MEGGIPERGWEYRGDEHPARHGQTEEVGPRVRGGSLGGKKGVEDNATRIQGIQQQREQNRPMHKIRGGTRRHESGNKRKLDWCRRHNSGGIPEPKRGHRDPETAADRDPASLP